MFSWLFGGSSRNRSRHTPGADRAERNAVIKRVVAAAARNGQKNADAEAATTTTVAESGAMVVLAPSSNGSYTASESGRLPQDRIADRAYEIWVRNGRPTGTQERDWQQAVRELEAELHPAPRTTVAQ